MRPQQFGQDITNTTQNDNNNEEESTPHDAIIERLTQNGATPVAHIAGKGIIRVVSRCEDAKENNNLGEILMIDENLLCFKNIT